MDKENLIDELEDNPNAMTLQIKACKPIFNDLKSVILLAVTTTLMLIEPVLTSNFGLAFLNGLALTCVAGAMLYLDRLFTKGINIKNVELAIAKAILDATSKELEKTTTIEDTVTEEQNVH